MTVIATLSITWPRWRMRVALCACVLLARLPMPDHCRTALASRLAGWVSRGLTFREGRR